MQIMIDKKQLQAVEYFSYLGSMTTNDARCTWESKSKISMEKAAFIKENCFFFFFFASKLDLNLRKKLVNSYIWWC
jgi:hypothetical protein